MSINGQPARYLAHRGTASSAPAGASPADEATVAAAGKLSEALEIVERAHGVLCGFHRPCSRADLTLPEAVNALRDAGHPHFADQLDKDLVGRNVIGKLWSSELVEGYDAQHWQVFRAAEHSARRPLDIRKHEYEAHTKAQEQSADPGSQHTQHERPAS